MDSTHLHFQGPLPRTLGFVSLEVLGLNGRKPPLGDVAGVSVNLNLGLSPDYFGLLVVVY